MITGNEGARSEAFLNYVFDNYGDDDVKQGTGQIDPAFKFYSGISLTIISNKDLKRGSGSGRKRRPLLFVISQLG